MTTKRIITLLLVILLLACLALSACGGEETETSSKPDKDSSRENEGEQNGSDEGNNYGESSYIDIELPGESSDEPSADTSSDESLPDESMDESIPSDVSGENSSDLSGDVSPDVPGEIYYQNQDGVYVLDGVNMPAFPSISTTFTICVYGNGIQTTYYSEEVASDVYGSRIESFVKLRNNDLRRDFGITVQGYRVDDVVATVTTDSLAGTAVYDAAMPFLSGAVTLAQEGMLYDLNSFSEYIHFEAPWWESSLNQLVAIDGHQYFAVGDITFSQKKSAVAVLFNKSIDAMNGYDLYGMVNNGTWTMDKMFELAKAHSKDSDGVFGMSITDSWGIVGSYNLATYHYLAAGESLLTVDATGVPKVAIDHTDSLATMLRVLQSLQNNADAILNVQKLAGVPDVWNAGLSVFSEGRALFYITPLVAVDTLRSNAKVEFGILPMPKTSVSQSKYYTPVSAQSAYGICIPRNVSDPFLSAYMIEAMACYSKNSVTPEYEEGLLRSKNNADWDSRGMLEIIFGNMHYDLGVITDMGGAGSLLPTMYRENTSAVASKVYATIPVVQTAIDNYLLEYRLNG